MSGARTNVVAMPLAAQAAPPQAQPASPWPMNPIYPIPPVPLWAQGGGMPAGCCPPGGMDALLQCYCDVQSATAFISKVVQDLAANDPAFQQSLVDAIVASGSNVPLIGVTNGSVAQAGQVGEYVQLEVAAVPYGTAPQTQSVTMGILQPGDWTVWQYAAFSSYVTGAQFQLSPEPVGFSHVMFASLELGTGGAQGIVVVSPAAQASIAVPTLVVFSLTTNANAAGPSAGTALMQFCARRAR